MRKFLPYLSDLVVLCLLGCVCYYLLRKLSSSRSCACSESLENELGELKSWKKQTVLELESQFDRVQSVCGRLDRARRKEKTSQEAPGSTPEASLDLDDQAVLNRVAADRLFGGINGGR